MNNNIFALELSRLKTLMQGTQIDTSSIKKISETEKKLTSTLMQEI